MSGNSNFSPKKVLSLIMIFTISNVVSIPIISAIPISQSDAPEWWVQVEIHSENLDQNLNDDILVDLYDNIIQKEREHILTWHFFREPTLRFRLEIKNKDSRDRIAEEILTFLQSIETVEEAYFANHEQRVTNLEEGYAGEREDFQGMWPYQKKIWEWGAEMTVAAIKEVKAIGENEPTREYQLTRAYHLLANQLSPGFDIWYCFRPDNTGGSYVILSLIVSFTLGVLFTGLINSLRALR